MRFKHIKPLTESELKRLDELRMNPRSLQKFASSSDADGIRAGFEAELIFSGLGGMGDDFDSEPDYDYDERARSISDIMDFFSNDDNGMGLSERGAERLQNQLDEGYYEWADDQMIRDFNNEAVEQIQQWMIDNNEWDWDDMIREAVDELALDSELEEKVLELADITKASERMAFVKEHPDYKEAYEMYGEAHTNAENRFDDEADQHYQDQDGVYDSALENFRENWDYPETGDWLNDVGLRWMSDVANEYNLDWPYWTQQDSPNGEYDYGNAEMLAKSLSAAMGVKAKASNGYHSSRRDDVTWIFEPDSSLDPDESDNMPVEVVSPPMPLNDCLKAIENFFTWAEDNGAYTNESTGFHMGVSLPHTGGKTDFIKLALFLGDEHVLKEFGRQSNHFAEAAIKKIRQKLGSSHNKEQIAGAMELMRNNLIELATKQLKIVGVEGFGKYTSINPHVNDNNGGYIEFRSAGGTSYHENIDKLKNTLLRYAQAMHIASRPDLERNEYYKKLYKLISPTENSSLDLFAQFATGSIGIEELKKQWAEKTLKQEIPDSSKSNWKLYNKSTGEPVSGAEYSNYTEKEAFEKAKSKVSPASSIQDFKQAYELRDTGTNTGKWSVIRRDNYKTLEIINATTRGEAVDKAYEKYTDVIPVYIEPYSGDKEPTPEPKLSRRAELAKRIKQGPKGQQRTPHGVPEWELYDVSTNHAIHTVVAHDKNDAWQQADDWLRSVGAEDRSTYKERFAIRPLMIDNQQSGVDTGAGNFEFVYEPTGRVLDQVNGINRMQANAVLADVRRRYDDLPADSIVMRRVQSGVRDIPMDVAQNISGSQNFSDPEQQIRDVLAAQRQRAQNIRDSAPRADFEFYVHDRPEEVFHSMDNATAEEVRAYIEQQEQGGMPPGFLRVRQVGSTNESLKVTPVPKTTQDPTRTKYNQVPRKDDPSPQTKPGVTVSISPSARKLPQK